MPKLNIETKENSTDRLAYVQAKGSKWFILAEEINAIVKAVNELYDSTESLPDVEEKVNAAKIAIFQKLTGNDSGELTTLQTAVKTHLIGAINSVQKQLNELKLIDDSLEDSKEKTYSIDKIKVLVNDSITQLIDGAPDALNTLRELATELEENESVLSTLLSQVSNKMDKPANPTGDSVVLDNGTTKPLSELQKPFDLPLGKGVEIPNYTIDGKPVKRLKMYIPEIYHNSELDLGIGDFDLTTAIMSVRQIDGERIWFAYEVKPFSGTNYKFTPVVISNTVRRMTCDALFRKEITTIIDTNTPQAVEVELGEVVLSNIVLYKSDGSVVTIKEKKFTLSDRSISEGIGFLLLHKEKSSITDSIITSIFTGEDQQLPARVDLFKNGKLTVKTTKKGYELYNPVTTDLILEIDYVEVE